MKKILWIITLIILITLTIVVTWEVFDTPFAEVAVDWLAFLAGIFLAWEGLYKIIRSKGAPFFPDQMFRTFRVIIGASVFTIHLLQLMR